MNQYIMKLISSNNYKKGLKITLLSLAVGLLAVSCVDLDQQPKSHYTMENYEPSPESFEAVANGLYRKFYTGNDDNGNYEFNTRVFAMSVGADDVIRGSVKDGTNNRVERIDELDIYPYSSISADDGKSDVAYMWRGMYGTVQAASSFIKDVLLYNISDAVFESDFGSDTSRMVSDFNLETYERLVSSGSLAPGDTSMLLLGEGYFMRALAYFYLVRFFGEVPCYADHTNRVSINGIAAVDEQVPRSPLKDIYEKMIVRDLKLAAELLPEISRSGSNDRPSKWAAKTCLADVYLHMAGWPLKDVSKYADAAAAAKEVIDNAGLSLTGNYRDLWLEATKKQTNEHIFAIQHYISSPTSTSWASNYGKSYYAQDESDGGSQTGWADYLMDSAFYESYRSDDRRKTFIAVVVLEGSGIPWKSSLQKAPPINKYRDYGTIASAQSEGITPIYRYAQVLLMYAEASNMADGGPNAFAEQCVKDVQARSNISGAYLPAGLDRDGFDEAVFTEFGWEFAVEAKRWFQLVRKERVVERNQFNTRVKAKLDARGATSEAAAQNGKGYLFPIPTETIELAAGSGVIITQNPGY